MSAPSHRPVMLEEVTTAAAAQEGDLVVDATFGAGGYSEALLACGARVVAFDRDPSCRAAGEALAARFDERFQLVSSRFSELEIVLTRLGAPLPAAIVFDVGVSSMQLDDAERGFSFMRDGPLDMRMANAGPSAADLVNTADIDTLARIFRDFGEERRARHVANVLASRRLEAPFVRTLDLADTVERALGGRRGAPIHPATRVFQALRIAVNDEIAELETGLAAAERVLAVDGRLVVVTFHSLEDRVVKSFLTARAGRAPTPSRHLPTPPSAGSAATFTLLFKGALRPTTSECEGNPRARSAKLRAAVRTAVHMREAA